MYAGLAPQDALAIYAVISYMDCVRGVYFPRGGMHALPVALAAAAADPGSTSVTTPQVSQIDVARRPGDRGGHRRRGDGSRADVVVVNADLPIAYRELLDPEHTPAAVKRLTYSPSCVLLHAGSSAGYDRPAAPHDRFRRRLGAAPSTRSSTGAR